MTPKEYLDRYTSLDLVDPGTGLRTVVNINGYGSGWGPEKGCNRTTVGPKCSTEYNSFFVPALRVVHHGKNTSIGATKFFFNQNPVSGFLPTEDFYISSFVNTFVGKGSPDEIRDTLRVALAIGRIGVGTDPAGNSRTKATLQQYVDDFMTLDCNGLTGNFYGIDPNTPVEAYANPARRRQRVGDVQVGDAVVTIPDATGNFEHVALIAEWSPVSAGDDTGTVNLKLVEWGQEGDESRHYTGEAPRRTNVTRGPNGKYGIGFRTDDASKFRYIFAPPQRGEPRGW
jgi:hypothetical protein